MEQIFRPFNLFSYKLNFTYKRNKDFDSFLGLIMSFIVYCQVGFLFYYFSKDFFFQTNPKLNYKEKMLSGDNNISLLDLLSSLESELSIELNKINSTDDSDAFDTKKFFNEKNYTIANFIWTQILIQEDYEKAKEENYAVKNQKLKFSNFEEKNFENNILSVYQIVDNKSQCESLSEIKEETQKQNNTLLNSFDDLQFNLTRLYKIQISLMIDEELLKKENLTLDISYFSRKAIIKDHLIEVDLLGFGQEYPLILRSGFDKKFYINSYSCYEFFFTIYEVMDDLGIIFSDPKASSFF